MSYIIQVPYEYDSLAEAQEAAKRAGIAAVYELKLVSAVPALFTEEERDAICNEIDLHEYVSNHVCGDGLEYDVARSQIRDMTDVGVVETLIEGDYYPPFVDDDEIKEAEAAIRAAVAKHAPDKVEAAVAAWRASL